MELILDWDDENVEHVAEHNVEPEEVEEALSDPQRIPMPAHSTSTERRWGLIGATDSGRILCVFYTRRGQAVRVITAYDASERQKRRYRRGRK